MKRLSLYQRKKVERIVEFTSDIANLKDVGACKSFVDKVNIWRLLLKETKKKNNS